MRDTPTLESMGLPIRVAAVRGVFVPKATSDAVAKELAGWVKAATKDPDFVAFGKKFGYPPAWVPGREFRDNMNRDLNDYNKIYDSYIKATK